MENTPQAFEPPPWGPSEPLHFPEQQVAVKTYILQELIKVFYFRRVAQMLLKRKDW